MNWHVTIATQSLMDTRPAMPTKLLLTEIVRREMPRGELRTTVLTAVQLFTELMTDLCMPDVFMADLRRKSRLI